MHNISLNLMHSKKWYESIPGVCNTEWICFTLRIPDSQGVAGGSDIDSGSAGKGV